MVLTLSRRSLLATSVGALIGTSGCLGGGHEPYIPGGSIEFDNETGTDATARITVRHVTGSQGDIIDYRRQHRDPSTLDDRSPPRELTITAQANSTTVVKKFIDSTGVYYLHARLDSGQRSDWWYWFDEHHFLSLWLEGEELQFGEAGNYE